MLDGTMNPVSISYWPFVPTRSIVLSIPICSLAQERSGATGWQSPCGGNWPKQYPWTEDIFLLFNSGTQWL